MRTVILLLLLAMTMVGFSQTPSNCVAPQALLDQYHDDVRFLAANRIYQTNAPAVDSLFVPQAYLDTIWEGLAAIYNVPNIPQRDSVFDLFCIHQNLGFPNFLHRVNVHVDTSYAWTSNWQNSVTQTGNSELDSILALTQFSIVNYSDLSNQALLQTPIDVNIFGVINALESIDGVTDAYSLVDGDGNGITYDISAGTKTFSFRLGCGDCPAGCTSSRTWNFSVSPSCEVTYLGLQDNGGNYCVNDLSLQCGTIGINEEQLKNLMVYPNPTSSTITLQTQTPLGRAWLTDLAGRRLMPLQPNGTQWQADLSALPHGMYLVEMFTEDGAWAVKKVVRE